VKVTDLLINIVRLPQIDLVIDYKSISNVCVTLIDNRLNHEFRNYNCYHWYANGNNNSSQ